MKVELFMFDYNLGRAIRMGIYKGKHLWKISKSPQPTKRFKIKLCSIFYEVDDKGQSGFKYVFELTGKD